MKRILLVTSLFVILFTIGSKRELSAQISDEYCHTLVDTATTTSYKSLSSCDSSTDVCVGRYKPGKGTLKMLMVYIRFEDDNTSMSYWNTYPDTSDIYNVEPWMAESLDSTTAVNSDNYFNLTNYFSEMSNDSLVVIGDVIYVQVPSKSTFSGTGLTLMKNVNKYVIEYLDSRLDLSEYDNFEYKGDFHHDNNSDDIIDMVYMIYRTPGADHFGNFGGIALLGGSELQTLPSGNKVQYNIFSSGSGSGLTIQLGNNRQEIFDDSYVHELAHYIMGGNHPYTDRSSVTSVGRTGYWGMFGGNRATNSMNAYEKEILGWIDVPEITFSSAISLDDFMTTKEAFKYVISPTEFYYFENRQRIQTTTGIDDTYDQATLNDNDKGLFVLHVKENSSGNYLYQTGNSLESVVSDGNFDWVVDSWSVACGSNPATDLEPAYAKFAPNQFGESFKDPLLTVTKPTGGSSYKRSLFIKAESPSICKRYFKGFDTSDKSSFTQSSRSLVAPYTNPAFLDRAKNHLDIGMKINSKAGNALNIQFYDTSHDYYSITESLLWDRQIFLDQDASISGNSTVSIAPSSDIYSNATDVIDVNSTGKIFVENDGSKSTVTIKDGVTVNVNSGGFLEIDDATSFPNRTEIIVEGTLNINSGATLDIGDYGLIFVQNGGQVNVDPNATIIEGISAEFNAGDQGTVVFTGNTIFSGGSSCLMTLTGGEMRFEGTLTMENGSFIQSHGSGGGTYVFEENVNLYDGGNSSGYVMDLFYGTEMQMDYSVDIIVHNGSKIRSVGTLADPVTFTYRGTYVAGTDSWETMELRGDGNVLEYTILENATNPLYFRSDNNVVEYSTIRNNSSYGIRTNSDYSGGWGSVTITDSDIHDNGSHGVYFRKTHGGIQYSNVKDNGGDGVYIYDATIGNPNSSGSEYFRGNDVQDNNGSAVELAYNATLYDGYSSEDGNNNLGHNGSHEVYLSSSSARWYDANGGSYSAVLDNTSSKFVYNLAQTTSGESTVSWTVGMENNAWNYAVPSSSKFHGSVDYTPYQTGQIFGTVGPRGTTPSEMNGGELPQMVLSAAVVEAETSGMNSSSEKDAYLEQTREINKLIATINGNPQSRMVAKNLNGLIGYYNQLPESKKSEFDEVPGMLRSFIADRQLAREVSFGTDGSRLTSETALMLQIHQTLQDGDAQKALNEINKYKATFSNLDIKRELGFIEANALEQLGKYNQAIRVYEELSVLSKLGIDSENTTTDYQTLVTTMEELRDEQTKETNRSVATESADKVKEVSNTKEDALPTSFALNEAYPNPFNPSTTFSFDMPETGVVRVEIFDITGRMVSVLTNKRYEAGRHNLQFNAEGLASGVYLVRANLAGTIQSQKVTLIK